MLLSNSKESPGFSRGESQKPVKHDSIFGYSAAKILLVESIEVPQELFNGWRSGESRGSERNSAGVFCIGAHRW
jgi:hypothetical protein